jgi:hypothetical protein
MDIEVCFNGLWLKIAGPFKTRDDAEWALARWKEENQCYGGPFRIVKAPDLSWTELQD